MGPVFLHMSAAQCHERIARGGVGRVVWCSQNGPRIYPVNYVVVDGDIVFRTAPYTGLGREVSGRSVVLEVDEIDYDAQRGWSVIVQADATAVDDLDEIMRLRRQGPEPWAHGQRHLLVRLRPRRVSGRLVGDQPENQSAG